MQQNIIPAKLPKLGDVVLQVMTGTYFGSKEDKPEPCTVIYVNKPKHHYTVQFANTGIRENYKLPPVNIHNIIKQFQDDFERAFGKHAKGIYVYESGALYPNVSDCADAIGVQPYVVDKHLNGQISNVKGYHIFILD